MTKCKSYHINSIVQAHVIVFSISVELNSWLTVAIDYDNMRHPSWTGFSLANSGFIHDDYHHGQIELFGRQQVTLALNPTQQAGSSRSMRASKILPSTEKKSKLDAKRLFET